MRLTLRTLLAYLDNTLEPADAEILKQKLEQSAFATQLVQQIRGAIASPNLSAPSPDSVHPIEEPNMMSNYLDSTLSPEQVAEIEKACLESLPHLAEAGACHQILTLVLGRPAEVTDRLRGRVLSMVDSEGNSLISDEESESIIAGEIGPRYSGVDVPQAAEDLPASESGEHPEGADEAASGTDFEAAAVVAAAGSSSEASQAAPPQPVRPVGADDSGVFQAATKLREQSQQFAGAGTALDGSNSIAGDRALRELERSDFYEGDVRTSRITPWLVTLALVAVLLFAVSQIFAPLLGPARVAQSDNEPPAAETEEQRTDDDGDAEPAEPGNDVEPAGTEGGRAPAGAADDEADADADADAAPQRTNEVTPGQPEGTADAPAGQPNDNLSAAAEPNEPADPNAPPPPPGMIIEPKPANDAAESATVADDSPPRPADAAPAPAEAEARMPAAEVAALPDTTRPEKADAPETTEAKAMKAADDAATPAVEEIGKDRSPADAEAAGGDAETVATLVSESAFVAAADAENQWNLVAPQSEILGDTRLVCGPEYRAAFAIADQAEASMTLVGATEVRLLDGPNTVDVRVRFGRGVIKLTDPGSSVSVAARETTLTARTETPGAVLAFQVVHQRDLGDDPFQPQNRSTRIELASVTGDFTIEGLREAIELPQGGLVSADVSKTRQPAGEITQPESLPVWIDPEVDAGSLEAEAADALLALLRDDDSESLLLSLRVALHFRRNEVAALAGRTMLALGDASAYFGVDGLLSDPRQRLYWSSHLDALREMIARSVTDAAAVRTAIAGQNAAMDNADGDTLFRLLVGYSQEDLENGGDAELVADLDSVSMPVRVLASEHLRDISGTTLFFRPEEVVASRRDEVVKKWKVRLRKASIRYPESE